ncbi:MAG: hypothetical protein LQ337_004593 [Flavoplaca oasis]|nr:MAG: hypothetical protein LQ337_004593 [Flavoplaca oasis]
MALHRCCNWCDATQGLTRCAACKVTLYCSRDHQVLDRKKHATHCKVVKLTQVSLDREEQTLRDDPGDGFSSPAYPFETSVGQFWGFLSTRDYMRARYRLVVAILKIKTSDAVSSAAEHVRDILHLNRSDNMGVRDMLPAIYVRLGRDQDAYDFIKWNGTIGSSGDYDWGNMDLPYLDVVDADVFESPRYLCGKWPTLSWLICATLIKIRLLLDLVALLNSGCLAAKLPQELFDRVKLFIPSTGPVWKNRAVMSRTDYSSLIVELSSQVDELYVAVIRVNKHFWPALLNPGAHLTATPEVYSPGTENEMQRMLQFSYDSWVETPGSIDFIRTMSAK